MEFSQTASENDRPLLRGARLCLLAGLQVLRVKRLRLKERRKHPETDTQGPQACAQT